jgi:hypothetical protein
MQNYFPLSDTVSRGKLCLHIHLENSAEATVGALLSWIATSSAYFEYASVIHKMNFQWSKKIPTASMALGLRKSAGILLHFLYFITKLYLKRLWLDCSLFYLVIYFVFLEVCGL